MNLFPSETLDQQLCDRLADATTCSNHQCAHARSPSVHGESYRHVGHVGRRQPRTVVFMRRDGAVRLSFADTLDVDHKPEAIDRHDGGLPHGPSAEALEVCRGERCRLLVAIADRDLIRLSPQLAIDRP